MAFCGKCGSKINEGDAFCSSCGAKTNSSKNASQRNNSAGFSFESSHDNMKNAAKLAQYFCCSIAALSLLALLMKDNGGLLISGALVAVILFGAYMPLKKGQAGSAATVCIICAGISAVIGLMVLMKGNGLMGILDIAAAIPGFMAWNAAKNL